MLGTSQCRLSLIYTNQDAPSTTPGTSVTPGAANAEGSWTEIASAASIAADIYALRLLISGGSSNNASKEHLLDLGIDPAGGTGFAQKIANILCGSSSNAVDSGRQYYFPFFIKAGSSVAVRIQGSNGTPGTVRVMAEFFGNPTQPPLIRAGVYSETIGAITNSSGVGFTPGNTGAEGAWQSLGTTVNPLWWWQLAVGIDQSATTALMYFMDLAYGDAGNKVFILRNHRVHFPGTAERTSSLLECSPSCYCDVPAGATLYVRGSCSGTAVTGFNAVAIGIGG